MSPDNGQAPQMGTTTTSCKIVTVDLRRIIVARHQVRITQ